MSRALMLLGIVALSAVVLAQSQPASLPASGPASGPTSSLGSWPVRATSRLAAADVVKDLFDNYDEAQERTRFLEDAGIDGELSAQEWQAVVGKSGRFVRSSDRWEVALAYDKDRNKQLNWGEAQQYREATRQRLLAQFDRNKDGKLTDAERDEANQFVALAAERSRWGGGWGGGRTGGGWVGGTGGNGAWGIAAASQPGAGGAWQIGTASQPGALAAAVANIRQQMMQQFDTNGDGQLDEQERQAMLDQYRRRGEDMRRQWQLRQFDKDGDGQLSADEQAAADAQQRGLRESVQKLQADVIKRWDADGDGQLSAEERQTMTQDFRREAQRRMSEIDTEGDGQISPQEGQAYWQTLIKKYDADGDGQLNDDERRNMIQSEMQNMDRNRAPEAPSPA